MKTSGKGCTSMVSIELHVFKRSVSRASCVMGVVWWDGSTSDNFCPSCNFAGLILGFWVGCARVGCLGVSLRRKRMYAKDRVYDCTIE